MPNSASPALPVALLLGAASLSACNPSSSLAARFKSGGEVSEAGAETAAGDKAPAEADKEAASQLPRKTRKPPGGPGDKLPSNSPTPAPCVPGGSGSLAAPVTICDIAGLSAMRDGLDKHYVLGAAIDLNATRDSASAYHDGGKGWIPVGTSAAPFTGSLDGKGKLLTGLYIQRPGEMNVGLFGVLAAGAAVTNLRLDDVEILGQDYVGAVAGLSAGEITDVQVPNGAVAGGQYVGGLVGQLTDAVLADSRVAAAVSGTYRVGGAVGYILGATSRVSRAEAHGDVDGGATGKRIGGFVGAMGAGSVEFSHATGAVQGLLLLGGFVGHIHPNGIPNTVGITLDNCYATGDVTSAAVAADITNAMHGTGGFVGHAGDRAYISRAYATGDVSGYSEVGGFVGGSKWHSLIVDAFATGDVSGHTAVGGFTGLNDNTTRIRRAYASGSVAGSANVGGYAGSADYHHHDIFAANPSVTGTSQVGALFGSTTYVSAYNAAWYQPSGSTLPCVAAYVSAAGHDCTATTTLTDFHTATQATLSQWDFTTTWTFPATGSLPTLRDVGAPQ